MTDAWQMAGTLANVAGLTGFAISGANGIVEGYQAYASPNASLKESERKLKISRSRLQGLSQQQRDEIEIAMRSKATNCKSLEDLEGQLQTLMDTHCMLTHGYGEVTFAERHLPYSTFRKNFSDLQEDASELLNDTLTATEPYLTPSTPLPDDAAAIRKFPHLTPSTPLPDDAAAIRSRAVWHNNESVVDG